MLLGYLGGIYVITLATANKKIPVTVAINEMG